MIFISACLVGQNVRYDGGNKLNNNLKKLVDKGIAKPICPEILGGLSTPRNPAEIVGGDGFDVLILKSDSPTCSTEHIYTGEFNGEKKRGVGVFSALLIKNGIKVYNEKNYNI